MTTTASTNYTGLYAANASPLVPSLPYGNSNVASYMYEFLPTYDGNLSAGNISATGNITTDGFFVGTFVGNVTGNLNVPGLNTEVLYNNAGNAGASANFTFNTTGNVLSVGGSITATGNVVGGNVNTAGLITATGNITGGNINTAGNVNGAFINGNISGATGGYGNANVAAYLPTYTGNLAGGNLTVSGIVSATGNVRGGNINTAGIVSTTGGLQTADGITAVGNIQGSYFLGNGSLLTGISTSTYGDSNVATYLASGTLASNVISTANISGQYILGNGAFLTGVATSSYGNANVAAFLAAFGSNSLSTTGNVTSGNVIAPVVYTGTITGDPGVDLTLSADGTNNINLSADTVRIGDNNTDAILTTHGAGDLIMRTNNTTGDTGIIRIFDGSNGNIDLTPHGTGIVTTTTVSATGNITGGNISTAGTFTSGNLLTSGNLSVAGTSQLTGNVQVQDNLFVSNIAYLNGQTVFINGSTIWANSATLVSSAVNTNQIQMNDPSDYASIYNVFVRKDLDIGATLGGNITGNGWAVFTGSVTGNIVSSNTTISAGGNITGGNISGATINGNLVGATASLSGNITGGNINTVGLVSASGNINGGNVNTGIVSASGNITAPFFVGNGSALTGVVATVAASGSNTQIQYNNAGSFAGVSTLTFDNVTGNIAINTGSSANVNLSNMVFLGNIIQNTVAANAAVAQQPNRIIVGNGYNGSYGAAFDPLSMWRGGYMHVVNKYTIANADVNQTNRQFTSINIVDMNGGTLSSATRRIQGGTMVSFVGNGTFTATSNQWASVSGGGGALGVGNIGNIAMGDTTISHGVGAIQSVILGTNGNIGNSVAVSAQTSVLSATGTVTNAIGFAPTFTGTPTTAPTTVIGYYMPNATATYGGSSSNGMRKATNYYFLKNDDDVAQSQLGSLRSYTEFNGVSSTTTGTWTIDKANGQVQQVDLTGNITSLAFTGFITNASDGTNTDEQCDTVTVIFNQGSTGGYTVAFPTPSSTIKYASNITALQTTAANSVTLVSISAIRISGTTTYLITISPGFV